MRSGRVGHRILPNWFDIFKRPGLDDGEEFIAYRSRRNGTWSVSPWPPAGKVVPPGLPAGEAPPWILRAARLFKEEMEDRGAGLVLTFVPTPTPDTRDVVDVAETLRLPLAVPFIEGLTSPDENHLARDSARLWSGRFVQALSPYLPR